MIATNKTPFIILFCILFVFQIQGQKKKDSLFLGWGRISYQKEKVYLLFKNNKGNYPSYRCKKFKNNKGINFNLCEYGSLLFPRKYKSDTVNISFLERYKISTEQEVKKKVNEFRYKTYKKLPQKPNSKLYQAYDNNDLFETYLIEVISKDKFVVYPVFWRNQRVIE